MFMLERKKKCDKNKNKCNKIRTFQQENKKIINYDKCIQTN